MFNELVEKANICNDSTCYLYVYILSVFIFMNKRVYEQTDRHGHQRKGPTNKVLIIFRKQFCEQNSFMYHNKVFYATKLYNKTQGSESVRVTVCNRP